ncbi:MAG TPA: non-canonical purine NTP pyrophosphatase [Verrucomicrobiales bacterium]|nr:non-canonical purine NTP pyrophosphatase [Verrucomicrobiales bacterium]
MMTLVIATRNAHKVQEIRAILGRHYRYLTLDDFVAAPPIREDGESFEENALKKSTGLVRWLHTHPKFQAPLEAGGQSGQSRIHVLADDSGLEVDALDGAPGVNSARFAHLGSSIPGNAPDAANNNLLLSALKGVPEERRTARFKCVLALSPFETGNELRRNADLFGTILEKRSLIVSGTCEGRIAFGPSGAGGFGYDPLFIPDGHQQSFAELGEQVKNRLSHRARALTLLRKWLDEQTKN